MSGLQIQEIQARLKNLNQPGPDKEALRQQLLTRANDPQATARDKKVYSQLISDLDTDPIETVLQNKNKYEMEPPEKGDKPEDITKQYSNALATGNTAEATRLEPLVKEFLQNTMKPSDKPDTSAEEDQRYEKLQADLSLKKPVSLEDKAWMAGYIKRKTLVPAFSFNLQSGAGQGNLTPAQSKVTGEDFLKTVSTSDAGILRALATGRMSLPSSFALRTPYWQRIISELNQYDPEYSEQRAQIRKAFTTGPDGRNIGNLNTAAVHLDALNDAAKKLGNGTLVPGNQLANYLKTQFGSSAPTNFTGLKVAVSGEMANALKGSATDIEIRNVGEGISRAGSPEQLAGIIDTNLGLIAQKLNTYKERYEQQQPDDTTWSPVLPSAAAVLEKHGQRGAQSGASSKPSGATHTGIGSVDKKKHWLNAQGHDLGVAE